MSLDDLRQAFAGWTYCEPYGSDDQAEIVQQHCRQQRSKQLQELTSTDHFPFGSWVCDRCERINDPRVNECPTLELALCEDCHAENGVSRAFFRCGGDRREQYRARPITRRSADNAESRNKRGKTLSELKQEDRERGAVSDSESRGATSASPERQVEARQTQRI